MTGYQSVQKNDLLFKKKLNREEEAGKKSGIETRTRKYGKENRNRLIESKKLQNG